MVKNLEGQRQVMLEQVYNEAREENNRFVEIHRLSPQVDRQEQYIQILNGLQFPVYQRRQYEIPCPTEATVSEQLVQEAILFFGLPIELCLQSLIGCFILIVFSSAEDAVFKAIGVE